ncbi:hypothetical protein GGF32_007983 [Allomyces javanicus]|nr:hypothetical protein GGF32_007983 [Allomyces javanicus]
MAFPPAGSKRFRAAVFIEFLARPQAPIAVARDPHDPTASSVLADFAIVDHARAADAFFTLHTVVHRATLDRKGSVLDRANLHFGPTCSKVIAAVFYHAHSEWSAHRMRVDLQLLEDLQRLEHLQREQELVAARDKQERLARLELLVDLSLPCVPKSYGTLDYPARALPLLEPLLSYGALMTRFLYEYVIEFTTLDRLAPLPDTVERGLELLYAAHAAANERSTSIILGPRERFPNGSKHLSSAVPSLISEFQLLCSRSLTLTTAVRGAMIAVDSSLVGFELVLRSLPPDARALLPADHGDALLRAQAYLDHGTVPEALLLNATAGRRREIQRHADRFRTDALEFATAWRAALSEVEAAMAEIVSLPMSAPPGHELYRLDAIVPVGQPDARELLCMALESSEINHALRTVRALVPRVQSFRRALTSIVEGRDLDGSLVKHFVFSTGLVSLNVVHKDLGPVLSVLEKAMALNKLRKKRGRRP